MAGDRAACGLAAAATLAQATAFVTAVTGLPIRPELLWPLEQESTPRHQEENMRGFSKGIAALAVGMLLGAPALRAQGAEFSLGGGVGVPLGDFDDAAKTGWHGLAAVSFVPNWLARGHSDRRAVSAVQPGRRCVPRILRPEESLPHGYRKPRLQVQDLGGEHLPSLSSSEAVGSTTPRSPGRTIPVTSCPAVKPSSGSMPEPDSTSRPAVSGCSSKAGSTTSSPRDADTQFIPITLGIRLGGH